MTARFIACCAFLAVAPISSGADNSRLERFRRLEWIPVRALSAVPANIRQEVESSLGSDGGIAERGGAFNATDVVDSRPSKRFVIAGRAGADWFVCYEQGGRGHHLVLAAYDSSSSTPRLTLLARGSAGTHDDTAGWKVGIHELKSALARGQLTLEDVRDTTGRKK